MYDTILVPVDGESGADAAIAHARDIAARFGATVHVLYVADTNRDSVTTVGGDVVDALEREGRDVVDGAAERFRDGGVDCRTEIVQGAPAETITEYADARGVDLVVMPTHGRSGLSRYLLGSVTEKVVRLSETPVLTLRIDDPRPAFPYDDVLVATDGSGAAEHAGERAADLAADLGATLHVLSVAESESLGPDVRSEVSDEQLATAAEQAIDDVAARAADAGVDRVVERIERGQPADEILDYAADEAVDLVVVGATGRSGIDRILLGGVTEKVVRSSPMPVMTVR